MNLNRGVNMKKILAVFLFILMSFSFCDSYAQSDSTDSDSYGVLSLDGWFSRLGIKLKGGREARGLKDNQYNPFIELSYSYPELRSNEFNRTFRNTGDLKLSLGHESLHNSRYSEKIKKITNDLFSISYMKGDLSYKKDDDQMKDRVQMWQFGWGTRQGHGFEVYENGLVEPYYYYGINWSDIKFAKVSSAYMDRFDERVRFGTTVESGVKLRLNQSFRLNGGYQRNLIFPGVMVWKQSASYLIDVIAMEMLDSFIGKASDNSPYMGTVFRYVLKGGLLCSMAQLRHEKMAWPFNSAAPIYRDSFTLGLSVIF